MEGRVARGTIVFTGVFLLTWIAQCQSLDFHFPPSFQTQTSKSNLPQNETTPLDLKICQIQGSSFSAPSEIIGKTVRVRGVVYADLDDKGKRGFFMQHTNCDSYQSTSDGIFVYIGPEKVDVVQTGDRVEVVGIVQEYYGNTEISTLPNSISVLAHNKPLPTPVDLSPPFENNKARYYFETLEGMYVSLDEAQVVGPTSSSDETWVVRSDLGLERVFQDDPLGTGEVICVDDGGLYEIFPETRVGDRVNSLAGAMDYSFGLYRMQLISPPQVTPLEIQASESGRLAPPVTAFTISTLNLYDLFDDFDDPLVEETILSTPDYHRRLKKRALAIHDALGEPDLIAIQEIENSNVLQALVDRPEIESHYEFEWVDSPDQRGLDVGLLYRTERIEVINHQPWQGCTTLIDGLGPDGNGDVYNPQNRLGCDTDGDGTFDGNRLFSRPPLQVRLKICLSGDIGICTQESEWLSVQVIVNHWKSKIQDTPWNEYTLPRRIEQARFVAGLVQEIKESFPDDQLIVLGDLNDFPDSQPLSILKQTGLVDLVSGVNRSSRYTYIYQGVSQVLDYIFYFPTAILIPQKVDVIHINSDYPNVYTSQDDTYLRGSDHDPVLVTFQNSGNYTFLPTVIK